jgi:hypothetical protein
MWLIFSDGSKARFHFRWEGRKEYGTKRQYSKPKFDLKKAKPY